MLTMAMARPTLVISALLAVLLSSAESNDITCEDSFVNLGYQCIYLSGPFAEDRKNHEQAIEACSKKNGFLAEILDNDQQLALSKFIREEYPLGSHGDWWVGGKKNNGRWSWDNSQLQVEGDWQIGEPWGNGDCLLVGRTSGKYYGYPCDYKVRYVCEWIPDSVCLGRNCTNNSVCVPLEFNDSKCVCPGNSSWTPESVCHNSANYCTHSSLILLLLSLCYMYCL